MNGTLLKFGVFKQVLKCIQDEVHVIAQLVVITTHAWSIENTKCRLIEASIQSIQSQDSSFFVFNPSSPQIAKGFVPTKPNYKRRKILEVQTILQIFLQVIDMVRDYW